MTKRKTIKALLLITVFVLSIIFTGCSAIQKTPEAISKEVVAKVGSQEIKKADFDKMFGPVKASYEQKYGPEIWNKEQEGKKVEVLVKESALDAMIDDTLQLKKAADIGIVVTDEEVNAEIEKFKKYFDTEDKFKEFLSTQKMDLEYFKNQIKVEMTKTKLKEKLTEKVAVSDQELLDYYNGHQNEFFSVKASHILLEKEDEAKKALERAKAGEDFNKLAKELSKDPSAKTNNGDLGYFKRGQMVEAFENTAFSLQPGQISEIVQTQFGYHIIKVEDKKLDKFEDVKEELKNNIIGQKKETEYNKVMDELKKSTEIKKYTQNL